MWKYSQEGFFRLCGIQTGKKDRLVSDGAGLLRNEDRKRRVRVLSSWTED